MNIGWLALISLIAMCIAAMSCFIDDNFGFLWAMPIACTSLAIFGISSLILLLCALSISDNFTIVNCNSEEIFIIDTEKPYTVTKEFSETNSKYILIGTTSDGTHLAFDSQDISDDAATFDVIYKENEIMLTKTNITKRIYCLGKLFYTDKNTTQYVLSCPESVIQESYRVQ